MTQYCERCDSLMAKAEEFVYELGNGGHLSPREILVVLSMAMQIAIDSEYLVPAFLPLDALHGHGKKLNP